MGKRTLSAQGVNDRREDLCKLMDRYLSLVSRTSYRIMCDRRDSEWITVGVMMSIWQDLCSFPDDALLELEILRRTCRQCRIRLLRRRLLSLFSIDPDIFVASSPTVPSYDEYIARQAWQIFCRASSGLSDRQRVAFTLCELENIPEKTVATIGGFFFVSVADALNDAREAVMMQLEHYGRMSDYAAYVGFLRRVEDQLTDRVGLQRRIMQSIFDKG